MSPLPQRNPTTQEGINASEDHPLKEFALLVVAVVLIGALALLLIGVAAKTWAPLLPFSLEEKVTQVIDTETSKYQAQQQALQALTDQLIAAQPLPEDIRVKVHYLPDDTVNAFATLGGHIMVYQGLIDSIDSENALAMVLAHEIAHVRYRHPIQGLSQGLVIQLLLNALTGSNHTLQGVAGSSSLVGMMSFSRDMEREADAYALAVLEKRYGHTIGAETFFSRMLQQQQRPEWAAFLESHPNLGERIELIVQSQSNKNGVLTPLSEALQ